MDGITHINIYSKALTPLGRGLSNWDQCNIRISIGYFRTIEGLIFYLGSFAEELRGMDGYTAKKEGPKYRRKEIILPEDIFRGFIIEAMWAKITKDDSLRKLLKESTLPLTHYYNYSGKKVEIPKWEWQVEEWEKIRTKLKEGIY